MHYSKGIDVSQWQGDIDFKKVREEGNDFVFIRAMFEKMEDTNFKRNWSKAKEAGLQRGAYFFPTINTSITSQTNAFIDLIGYDKTTLPPIIDIEEYRSNVILAEEIKTSISIIERRLNVAPVIYTAFYVWRDSVEGSGDPFFADYPLWIASYGTEEPLVPKPWTAWTYWQYSQVGDAKSIGIQSRYVDLNYFNGMI